MCLLEETDSDIEIIEKLKKILNLSNDQYNKIINDSYDVSINNYTYKQGLLRFNKVIDYINNN